MEDWLAEEEPPAKDALLDGVVVLHMEGVVVSDEDIVIIVPVPVKDRVGVREDSDPVATGEVEDDKVASEAETDGEEEVDCVEDSEGVANEVSVTTSVFDCVVVP